MKATFIDCWKQGDDIILWMKKGESDIMLADAFVPKIYIRHRDLKGMRNLLAGRGIASRFEKKNSFYARDVWVLAIPVARLSEYEMTVRRIERITGYSAEIYNADLKPEEYYMFEKGIFPLAEVEVEHKAGRILSIISVDDIDKIVYPMPKFRVCSLAVKTGQNLFKGMATRLLGLRMNNELLEGSEEEMLRGFKQMFVRLDPDVVWAENGNLVLPYLSSKFREYGIQFNFSRFGEDDMAFRQGEHYFTYSRVVYRTHSIFLKGRLHFDRRSFFADDTGLHGILDGARVCRQRIQRTEMRSAGAAVTNLLMYTAHSMGFLLPYKTGIIERFKTMKELYDADRGSVIFEPRTGFHPDVAEFDYVSLYPNIMNRHNLSPETLYCRCCRDNRVPGLPYNYCKKNRGVVAIVAERLVKRRIALKAMPTPQNKEKVDYLKWLLVTMFGYQAFKNRKIGTIENHESIQSYARETLMSSARVAERAGWEVVHGIIDSVYVKKEGHDERDAERLGKELCNETGLEIAHDGDYRWMVFLPSVLERNIPVPTRFYGVTTDGKPKARGIELRRKDSPEVVKSMQREVIECLSPAGDEEHFRELFPKVFRILRNHAGALSHASPEELRIKRTLSKTEYKGGIAQKAVIRQMRREGFDIRPGQSISYIIRDAKNRTPYRRYSSIAGFDGTVDTQKYGELMARAVFGMLQPFGVTMAQAEEGTMHGRQSKVWEFEPLKKAAGQNGNAFKHR